MLTALFRAVYEVIVEVTPYVAVGGLGVVILFFAGSYVVAVLEAKEPARKEPPGPGERK
jgi:hypothetical protein